MLQRAYGRIERKSATAAAASSAALTPKLSVPDVSTPQERMRARRQSLAMEHQAPATAVAVPPPDASIPVPPGHSPAVVERPPGLPPPPPGLGLQGLLNRVSSAQAKVASVPPAQIVAEFLARIPPPAPPQLPNETEGALALEANVVALTSYLSQLRGASEVLMADASQARLQRPQRVRGGAFMPAPSCVSPWF